MSFVTTQPETLTAAAANLASIGSTVAVHNSAAAGPITGVIPAGADAVSRLTAAQFNAYGQLYRLLGAQAQVILGQFISTLRGSAGSYAVTEAANTALGALEG